MKIAVRTSGSVDDKWPKGWFVEAKNGDELLAYAAVNRAKGSAVRCVVSGASEGVVKYGRLGEEGYMAKLLESCDTKDNRLGHTEKNAKRKARDYVSSCVRFIQREIEEKKSRGLPADWQAPKIEGDSA